MGDVYKARDTRLDRTVAIKILSDALATDPQFRERFDREARSISQVTHPHICVLYDVGEQAGTAYLVMEYLEGETLEQRLKKGALPLAEALKTAIQISDALATAHRAGIVHRDLKPGNVMLTKSGAKLLDFGLAKTTAVGPATTGPSMLSTTPALTQHGTILGTLQYMAPEQLEGHDADARSDVFAFGVLLYEMITGRKAFDGRSQASLIAAIMHGEPPPIRTLQPLTPAALNDAVQRAMAKDPDERWHSAKDLSHQLDWIARNGDDIPAARADGAAAWTRSTLGWLAAAALALAAVATLGEYARRRYYHSGSTSGSVVEVQRLTDNGSVSVAAATRDGRYIAWVNRKNGELRLLQVASEREVSLLPASRLTIASLHFSPDGDFIYFLRRLRQEDPETSGVFRMATLGGPATPLATDARTPSSVTVSPDGKQVAYITRTQAESLIVAVDSDGRGRRVVAKNPIIDNFWFVEWSPSPDRMAAVIARKEGMTLVSIQLPSGVVRDFPSVSYWGALGQPAWNTDGTEIFAPALPGAGSVMQLWRINAQTGAKTTLTSSASSFSQWSLSSTTAGALVANTDIRDSSVWISDNAGASHAVPSIRGEGIDSLAWVDDRFATCNMSKIFVHERDSLNPTQLRIPSTLCRSLSRCGAGHVAYFTAEAGHGTFIARTELSTGATTSLTEGPIDSEPSCTADGRTLTFIRCDDHGSHCALMRKSLDSGQSVPLYNLDGGSSAAGFMVLPTVSPDGTHVLLSETRVGNSFQWATLVPMNGGSARTLTMSAAAGEIGAFKWGRNSQSIIYARRDAGGVDNIWSASADGRQPRKLTTFDSGRVSAFDVADDSRLAIVRGTVVSDVVIIRNTK